MRMYAQRFVRNYACMRMYVLRFSRNLPCFEKVGCHRCRFIVIKPVCVCMRLDLLVIDGIGGAWRRRRHQWTSRFARNLACLRRFELPDGVKGQADLL